MATTELLLLSAEQSMLTLYAVPSCLGRARSPGPGPFCGFFRAWHCAVLSTVICVPDFLSLNVPPHPAHIPVLSAVGHLIPGRPVWHDSVIPIASISLAAVHFVHSTFGRGTGSYAAECPTERIAYSSAQCGTTFRLLMAQYGLAA